MTEDIRPKLAVTRADAVEVLNETGVDVSRDVAVVDEADEADILIGAIYRPGEPLIMSGNIIALCAFGCGRHIQFRPANAGVRVKVCFPCAADAAKKAN